MAAPVLTSTESSGAELALVLLLGGRAGFASRGGRRVGGHERHVGGGFLRVDLYNVHTERGLKELRWWLRQVSQRTYSNEG